MSHQKHNKTQNKPKRHPHNQHTRQIEAPRKRTDKWYPDLHDSEQTGNYRGRNKLGNWIAKKMHQAGQKVGIVPYPGMDHPDPYHITHQRRYPDFYAARDAKEKKAAHDKLSKRLKRRTGLADMRYTASNGEIRATPVYNTVKVQSGGRSARVQDYGSSRAGGSYIRTVPAAISSSFVQPENSMAKQRMPFERTEPVDITCILPAAYAVNSVLINPGNPLLGQWLAKIARYYEVYQYTHLEFIYNPTCATSTAGRICLAWDPDPMDSNPTSFIQAMQIAGSATFSAWEKGRSIVPRAMLGPKYTNAKFIDTDNDAPDMDRTMGKFVFATEGGDGTTLTGYITCRCVGVLQCPQIHDALTDGYLHLASSSSAGVIADTTPNNWAGNGRATSNSNLLERGWSVASSADGRDTALSIPAAAGGHYMLLTAITSTTIAAADFSNRTYTVSGSAVASLYWYAQKTALGTSHHSTIHSERVTAVDNTIVDSFCFSTTTGEVGTVNLHVAGTMPATFRFDYIVIERPSSESQITSIFHPSGVQTAQQFLEALPEELQDQLELTKSTEVRKPVPASEAKEQRYTSLDEAGMRHIYSPAPSVSEDGKRWILAEASG